MSTPHFNLERAIEHTLRFRGAGDEYAKQLAAQRVALLSETTQPVSSEALTLIDAIIFFGALVGLPADDFKHILEEDHTFHLYADLFSLLPGLIVDAQRLVDPEHGDVNRAVFEIFRNVLMLIADKAFAAELYQYLTELIVVGQIGDGNLQQSSLPAQTEL
mgnify:CR=1 FL=1